MTALNFTNSPNILKGEIVTDPVQDTLDRIDELGIWTVDGAFLEFSLLYQERTPYAEVPMLDGPCYRWGEPFINACLMAMATDRMIQMSTEEQAAWRYFVNFENYHSTSAKELNANGTAIGCTNPNTMNKSYVVAGDGQILDGTNGNVEELCQTPGYEIEGEQIWKSLDSAFMSLYNCQEINRCSNSDVITDVSPCKI